MREWLRPFRRRGTRAVARSGEEPGSMDGGGKIELSDMVAYVIGQIHTAHQRASGDYTLSLQDCTIEMNVTVAREGGAGIRAYVVEAGGRVSAERVHRVVAKFRPYTEGDAKQTAMFVGDGQAANQPTYKQ